MVKVGLLGGIEITHPTVFYCLPRKQQEAILAHERAHAKRWHVIKRTLAAIWMMPDELAALHHAQEFEADADAKAQGYGPALAVALMRYPEEGSHTHPATKERVAKLVL